MPSPPNQLVFGAERKVLAFQMKSTAFDSIFFFLNHFLKFV